jgi:hypothetical protein
VRHGQARDSPVRLARGVCRVPVGERRRLGGVEVGPSLGVYPASGAVVSSYLSLETAVATPLAWSPDSRYLAVALRSNGTSNTAEDSGLDVIDTQTSTVTRVAAGIVYGASFARDGSNRLVFGLSHSEAFAGR